MVLVYIVDRAKVDAKRARINNKQEIISQTTRYKIAVADEKNLRLEQSLYDTCGHGTNYIFHFF